MPASLCLLLALVAAPTDDASLKLLTQFRGEFVPIAPANDSARPFAICKYETTQELYEAVMGANPSRWKGPRNSVEMTSLADAAAFCQKVTALLRDAKLIAADQEVRLPTDVEWEYCCRAGTSTKYHFGDDPKALTDYAWYTGNAAGNDPPVGVKQPNQWGLYDMHGYIAEWTSRDDKEKEQAHVRGGSWKSTADECLSSSKQQIPVATKDDAIGFRCVLTNVTK
ncbi:formylglycine-generating enzyme family protein [Blastopirellula sp. JC732]|uniref:Formylglycine-generating enzyme family protein n=1 Tax=Blastopirellula sediminis TaxID=2894196 RepID=A0A9X1MNV1_9BACT|nr:formylglycine-generating enzyme family protein [Blastopirellula sediminis]MCC9606702.1 formylglycine-generating enzyme family protein [Blastopirellula sediminis]MCC9630001.1 formylglycine-generating enzyme family protein [Blastopirellula sediminis]